MQEVVKRAVPHRLLLEARAGPGVVALTFTAYANVDGLVGIEVADVAARKMIHRVPAQLPDEQKSKASRSHGLGIRPDEKEIWEFDVEHPSTHCLEERHVRGRDLGIAPDDDGDLAGRGEVHSSRDGRLERCDPSLVRQPGEAQKLTAVVRAHVDPSRSGSHRRQRPAVPFENRRHRRRCGQARDEDVDVTCELRRSCCPGRAGRLELGGGCAFEIGDAELEPGSEEARRERSTKPPDADESDAHQSTTGTSSGVRCSSSPS